MEQKDDSYQKVYKMRQQGEGGGNVVVTIPPEIVEKEARKRNITVDEFVKLYRARACYNGFEGVLYTFEEA